MDLCGNVWEWTLGKFDGGSNGLEGDGPRVMRGGSWSDAPLVARASFRGFYGSNDRDGGVGFRVVLAGLVR